MRVSNAFINAGGGLPPFRLINPGGRKMNKTVNISLTAIFASLYAVGVILLAPISYGEIQIRVIDCLIHLSAVFGWPVVLGVTIGNIVANIFGGLGIIDIVGGTAANFIASLTVLYIKKAKPDYDSRKIEILISYTSALIATLIITLIVGSYLSIIFSVPMEIMVPSIFLGSFVAITIIGGTLSLILQNTEYVKSLQKGTG